MPERPSGAALLARATRAKTLTLIAGPVLVGAALAWRDGAPFAWGLFATTAIGAGALHLGANALNDLYDARSGADRMATIDRSAITTASGVIEQGLMTERALRSIASAFFAVALACGAILTAERGAAILVLGALGALLGWQYVAPPLRYGYRALGALGLFLAYGVLPVAGSYYVQAGRFSSDAFWAGLVPGLLTTLVFFHHDFLHWRADKAAGKRTPIVVLEPEMGVIISGVGLIVAYVGLIGQVAVGLFPAGALIALITMVPVAASWARAARDPVLPQNMLNLLGATLGADVITAAVLSVALLLAR